MEPYTRLEITLFLSESPYSYMLRLWIHHTPIPISILNEYRLDAIGSGSDEVCLEELWDRGSLTWFKEGQCVSVGLNKGG